jgi:hypothetical protein
MVLLGDVAQVEAQFRLLILTQDRCRTYPSLRNHFGRTRWNTKVKWVMWNLVLVYLEIVLVLVQDSCTVCAKHTVVSEIILDAPDSTPR